MKYAQEDTAWLKILRNQKIANGWILKPIHEKPRITMSQTTFTISPHSSEFAPSARWVRVYFNGQLIAESKQMILLRESDHLPVYYFPKDDVLMDFLQPS